MIKSIRWRLPLSYAAIALLTTLSLGAVLLTTLRSYYLQHELNYLAHNAQEISVELARMVQAELPPAALEAQLKSFSFLSQTRVRLLDSEKKLVADSGEPQDRPQIAALSIEIEANGLGPNHLFSKPVEGAAVIPEKDYASFIYLKRPDLEHAVEDAIITRTLIITADEAGAELFFWREGQRLAGTPAIASEPAHLIGPDTQIPVPADFISFAPAVRTPFGFGINAEVALNGPRSGQVISQPFYDAEGKLLGYAELSQGPAYGREIVASVAWGWAIASVVAVALAAGVGWLISRRLSAPLLALTEVTTRMAEGNLSVRADVARRDEVGQLAQAFNEMAGQVEQTVTTLRRFVADAAHELHTPLTALRTNLELAADESRVEQRSLVERAQAQVARLETLTRDLLDLSRLETGTAEVKRIPVNMNALVRETSELYASRAEQASLSFSVDVPDELIPLRGNEAQLRRALSNILDNALKFTPAGGAVRVGLRAMPEENWVELWVEDTGIGILPGDLPQLFNRFHRGRNAAAFPGSGLGLAIVKAIIEGHGGQVAVESTPQGACFRLRLPLS